LGRVSGRVAVGIEGPSQGYRLAFFLCSDDVAARNAGSSQIDLHWKSLAAGERCGDGIGAKERFVSTFGRHGRLTVGHGEQYQFLAGCVVAVPAESAKMLQ